MGSSSPIFGVKIKKYLKPPTRKGTWYAEIVLLEIFPSLNRTSGFQRAIVHQQPVTRLFGTPALVWRGKHRGRTKGDETAAC